MKPILFNTEMVKAIIEGRKTVTRRKVNPKYSNTHFEWTDGKYGKRFIEKQNEEEGVTTVHNENGSTSQKLLWCREMQAPYRVGDILYVRETYAKIEDFINYADMEISENLKYLYKCDDNGKEHTFIDIGVKKWHPSIHMLKEAARIFLKVTEVRVARLQDITEEQAVKEGIIKMYDNTPDAEYDAWAKRVCQGKKKEEWAYANYLWHGNLGKYGSGNKLSDAWSFQCSGYDNAIESFSSLWNTTVPLKDWEQHGWNTNPWVWVIKFEKISKEEANNDM